MNKNKHLILLVDASGSMSSHEKETQEAIVEIIKGLDQDTHLTTVFFDDKEYKILINKLVKDTKPEMGYLYEARGWTPITDSVFKAIQDISTNVKDIESYSENHKFVIFTDGAENASKHVTTEDLGRAIEHFTDNFGWNFQFIGPKSEGHGITQYTNSIKIKKENVSLYASVSEGLKTMTTIATQT